MRVVGGTGAVELEPPMSTAAELPWQELHSSLQAFVRRRVRNPADTDDLVQAVLLPILLWKASKERL